MPRRDIQAAGQRVAANIRRARRWNDLTQEDLAIRMAQRGHGWTAGTVGFVERGARNVTVDELDDLAAILNTTITAMVSDSGDPSLSVHGREPLAIER